MNSSRQAHFYTAMQNDFGPLRIWLGRLRLLTLAQRAALVAPLLALCSGALLAALLLAPARTEVGWLSTGGGDLRAFTLEPSQINLARDERGPRLTLERESLFIKYRQPGAAQQVQVHTPHTTAVARDAVFFAEVQGDTTRIGVQRGEVVLFSPDREATFAGPGDQLVVAGPEPRRVRSTHRHFSFLELIFPRPQAEPIVAAPTAPASTASAVSTKRDTTTKRDATIERVATSITSARADQAPRTARRRRGLLPRKPRIAPPAPQVATIVPRTAYDEQRADEELGAPVIISIEGTPPAPPTSAALPVDTAPQPLPAPRGETPPVFAPPASWWQ